MNGTVQRGFTLIELLVVMAIVAMLASLALPRYFSSLDAAKETVLVENLRVTREAIDKFHSDSGHYPASLDELVQKKYLKSVPMDPITNSSSGWIIVPPDKPGETGVYDLHSGAPGKGRNGSPLSAL